MWLYQKLLWHWICFILHFGLALSQSCKGGDANKSCGQCIKEGPDCAWCGDPNFAGNFRCDQRENLNSICREIFQPVSEVKKIQDVEIGSLKAGMNGTQVQVQPQQVQLKIRPGEALSFKLKYLHVQPTIATIYALNSEVESQGFSISYTVNCKGTEIQGRQCEGTKQSDIVEYTVGLRLTECKTSGDAVVSIGIGGVRDVVAVYISPICGCECEKINQHEMRSASCSGAGTLVCGKCVCEAGRGGTHCECGDESSNDQCRLKPGDPMCSGRGKCDCGSCKCDADYYSGTYCECDDTSCELSNGMLCYGKGACRCGTCQCDSGWTGRACDCDLSRDKCMDSSGTQCNGQGTCNCNQCTCQGGYSGDLCENAPTEAPATEEESTAEAEPAATEEPDTEGEEAGTEAPESEETEEEPSSSSQFRATSFNYLIFVFTVFYLFFIQSR